MPGPSWQEIEDALHVLRELMNAVAMTLGESQTAYTATSMDADGDSLLFGLAQAQRYAELVRQGVIDWADFRANSQYATTLASGEKAPDWRDL